MSALTGSAGSAPRAMAPAFSAIDLGTNNCRLLVAVPQKAGFRVIDAYSRIVRLGEGVSRTGQLSVEAMDRTVEALAECAKRMNSRKVLASRNIATQACRAAANGEEFLERIVQETGIDFEIVSPGEEAALSVRGVTDLIDPQAEAVLVFDIGGGSTELSWLRVDNGRIVETVAWTSLPLGVVTLAEVMHGAEMTSQDFDAHANHVAASLRAVDVPEDVRSAFAAGKAHLVGTSGTVTSMAGVHLGLRSYSRKAVDGLWMSVGECAHVAETLRRMEIKDRAASPCIGPERADLVVGGCAILEGIIRAWPVNRVRVGDRGLREGLLLDLIADWRLTQRRA